MTAFTLAVASGKGGTGKTLVSANLAVLAAASGLRTVLVDCDAEAPNDHLFFPGEITVKNPVEVQVAEADLHFEASVRTLPRPAIRTWRTLTRRTRGWRART